MANEVVRQASKCANCVAQKSRFLKLKHNKKTGWNKINPKLLIYQTQVFIKRVENIDSKLLKTNNDKTMWSLKCVIYGSRKSRFMKEQEAKGLLRRLRIKTPLSNILLLGNILF